MAFNSTDWIIDFTGQTVTNVDSGVGDNLPVTTGGTWFVGEMLEFFQWIAQESSTGTTIQHTYPINSVTPRVYEWVNGWGFGDVNDYKYLQGGSIISSGLTELWSNLYSLGTQTNGSQLYLIQNSVEIEPWWITGDIDILVKVKDGTFIQSTNSEGVDVDGGLWVYTREFGDYYDHNFIDMSGAGRNPISINTATDVNNTSGEIYISVVSSTGFVVDNFVVGGTSGVIGKIIKITSNDIYLNSVRFGSFVISETITEYTDRELKIPTSQSTTNDGTTPYTAVVSSYSDITTTFGSVTKDLSNGAGLKPYEVVIDCNIRPLSEVYEWLKYIVRYDSSGVTYTVDGDDGQEYRNASGSTWVDVKTAPFGTYAGGKFFGVRGVWIENMDAGDIQNYQLIDSNGDPQSPPELYSLTLADLINNTEIRVYTGTTAEGNQGEIAGVEDVSGNTFSYQYTYVSDFVVNIAIHHLTYVYQTIDNLTLSNSNLSIPIKQQEDRWYN